MKKLFTLISLTALFLVVTCKTALFLVVAYKKAEVFPVSANDTVRVDSVRVDTTQVATGKSDKVLLKEEDTSL